MTSSVDPFASRMAFEAPRRLTAASAWHAHIPFAFFCVELLRPDRIVELGTASGDSYCAFCQAVDVLELPTTATAFDSWEGDRHTGSYGPDVLAELRAYHDPLYGRFSQLVRCTFDDAAEAMPDGTVDILHIDGEHTYEAVRHDFETWLPKVSERGVVLLHDTDVRTGGFGVWRLWEEVEPRYPSLRLSDGHGLGVLAVGADLDPAFGRFLATVAGTPSALRLFAALGARVEADARADALASDLGKSEIARRSAEAELQATLASVSWRATRPLRWAKSRLARPGSPS